MRVGAGRGRALLLGALLALSAAPAAAQNAGAITGHSHSNTNVDCTARLGTNANGLVVENDQAVQTDVTTVSTSGVAGHTTYRVILHLAATVENVYTIYGDSRPMEFPPAYQVASPFGGDIGGVNPTLISVSPGAAFDSWLTVGITQGNDAGLISKIGIDFNTWSDTIGLVSAGDSGGAVFWMDPDLATNSVDRGVAGAKTVTIAQLTVRNELGSAECHFDAQGRSMGHSTSQGGVPDWEENCIALFVGGPQNGQGSHALNAAQTMAPPPPGGNNRCDTSVLRGLQHGQWMVDAFTQQASVQCGTFAGDSQWVAQGPRTRSCQPNSVTARWEWSPDLYAQPTTCVPAGGSGSSATCPDPRTVNVNHGYFQLSGPTTAELYCDPGFVKQPSCNSPASCNSPRYGSTTLTCLNGRWGSLTAQCNPAPPPSPPTPPPPRTQPTATPEDSSSTTTIVVVLLLLGAAGGVYAKQNGLGPFAESDGKKAVMGDPDAGGSTIYDQQTDESL